MLRRGPLARGRLRGLAFGWSTPAREEADRPGVEPRRIDFSAAPRARTHGGAGRRSASYELCSAWRVVGPRCRATLQDLTRRVDRALAARTRERHARTRKFDIDGGDLHPFASTAQLRRSSWRASGRSCSTVRALQSRTIVSVSGGSTFWFRCVRCRGAHQRLQLPGVGSSPKRRPAPLLAGMPVISKPATSSALVARIGRSRLWSIDSERSCLPVCSL